METSIQTSLCKGLRACGLRKEEVHEILNVIQKWYDSSGPEWTNARIKDLKAWYETYLAGDPVAPPWFRKSRSQLPLGCWGRLFRSPNPAKALAALSMNTVFVNRGAPSSSQREKFNHALNGNGLRDGVGRARGIVTRGKVTPRISRRHANDLVERNLDPDNMQIPTLRDMTKHIPVDNGSHTVGSSTKQERAVALYKSWESLPQATSDFLDGIELGDWIPYDELNESSSYALTGNASTEIVGRIACLQQPGLKARWIGNPNRVTQALMRPLASVWTAIDRADPCTCTFDQQSGVRWVQENLKAGVTLAGSDMTSASDLLSLEGALQLVEEQYFPHLEGYTSFLYETHVQHFVDVSRSPWACPRQYGLGESVRWQQGWCLGTAPSFPLLSLTNATLARSACRMAGIDENAFRVIGDDIIIDNRASRFYADLVAQIGGEVNLSKTLTSDRVAEFAGRIIFPDRVLRKTYRFRDAGDNGFMSYVSDLGPQASGLLRPRQRRAWEAFKYVPGIALDGPWSQDSFGVPLEARLGWALTSSGLLFEAEDLPDADVSTVENTLLYTALVNEGSASLRSDGSPVLPSPRSVDYLSTLVDDSPRLDGGDPRYTDLRGKTLLEHLEDAMRSPHYVPFEVWSSQRDDFQVQEEVIPEERSGQNPSLEETEAYLGLGSDRTDPQTVARMATLAANQSSSLSSTRQGHNASLTR